ncbi:MAG: flavodoxin family protein [Dehalococcoidales bacterium]|nr:flavodoxin family protein [Dehalococcoidales bacterium]
MKALVIYDSMYGNTEELAKEIGRALGSGAKVVKAGFARVEDVTSSHLVIIGSPTQGGRQTPGIKAFVDELPVEAFKDKRFAAFDTRFKNVFAKIFGYAAPRIESAIRDKGGNTTAQPQGFFVKGTKGPLLEGELERAATWAKSIAAGLPTSQMPGDYEVKRKEK